MNRAGLAVGEHPPTPQPDSFSRALNSSLKLTPARLLANDSPPGGTVLLRYTGIPGRSYSIQATPNLAPPVQWTTLGSSVADANGVYEWLDIDAPNHPLQFYRTEAPANP